MLRWCAMAQRQMGPVPLRPSRWAFHTSESVSLRNIATCYGRICCEACARSRWLIHPLCTTMLCPISWRQWAPKHCVCWYHLIYKSYMIMYVFVWYSDKLFYILYINVQFVHLVRYQPAVPWPKSLDHHLLNDTRAASSMMLSTGNHPEIAQLFSQWIGFYCRKAPYISQWENLWFPVNFPLNQSNQYIIYLDYICIYMLVDVVGTLHSLHRAQHNLGLRTRAMKKQSLICALHGIAWRLKSVETQFLVIRLV